MSRDREIISTLERVTTATITTLMVKKGLRNIWMRGRQIAAQRRFRKDRFRYRFQHELRPCPSHETEGNMQRYVGGGVGGVHRAAAAIQQIAGMQCEFSADRPGRGFVFVEALADQRQFDRGVVERPVLRAVDLQDEHIVGIPMRNETLCARRSEIEVCLKRRGKRGLGGRTELAQPQQMLLHAVQGNRPALIEQRRQTNRIRSAIGRHMVGGLLVGAEPDQPEIVGAGAVCLDMIPNVIET